jgi:hypothetical protein
MIAFKSFATVIKRDDRFLHPGGCTPITAYRGTDVGAVVEEYGPANSVVALVPVKPYRAAVATRMVAHESAILDQYRRSRAINSSPVGSCQVAHERAFQSVERCLFQCGGRKAVNSAS